MREVNASCWYRIGTGTSAADPAVTSAAIFKVVDSDSPPLRFFLGSAGLITTRAESAKRLEIWEKWSEVSVQAQGPRPPKHAQR
jgi:hypothetical protein